MASDEYPSVNERRATAARGIAPDGSRIQREVELVRGAEKMPWDKAEDGGYAWYWWVRGRLGAISFTWVPDLPLWNEMNGIMQANGLPGIDYPWGVDLSYHTAHPIRDWHRTGFDPDQDPERTVFWQDMRPCELLPEGRCWTDGSGLRAEEVGRLLKREGEEAVWAYLADEYHLTFYEHTPAVGIGFPTNDELRALLEADGNVPEV